MAAASGAMWQRRLASLSAALDIGWRAFYTSITSPRFHPMLYPKSCRKNDEDYINACAGVLLFHVPVMPGMKIVASDVKKIWTDVASGICNIM